jgi:hypothetical protein
MQCGLPLLLAPCGGYQYVHVTSWMLTVSDLFGLRGTEQRGAQSRDGRG